MSILLDILGSTFIGGIVLLLLMKLNLFASTAGYTSDTELRMQQNVKTLAEILNYDLRKVGYGCDSTAILVADSTRIKFKADMQEPGAYGHGILDIVEYYVTDSTKASGTPNPRDRVLVRIVNGTDTISGPSLGLTKLRFTYLNTSGNITNVLEDIRYIKSELWLESSESHHDMFTDSTQYAKTYWEFTINPRNI